ncbi:hypothetical protein [Arenimonas fontis]|uniref:Haemolysin activator HlyB C-terminal domain-containing protein n=1 Tax=Arenimonas fontis TaxID=2608255 RepID=A0A5B2Z901_9GAMM|nr:hypothetical protein [Arenimonas fontis]KAA2285198.1 hypothetical protein F0415_04570 [Arenimonas fontis]
MNPLLRAIAATLLALAAAAAAAQTPPPLVVPEQASDDPFSAALPLVNQDNGRVEAFLLLDEARPTPATGGLQRLLGRDRSPSFGAGLAIPLDNGRRASASLSLETNPTLGLLCESSALARRVGNLARHCLASTLSPGQNLVLPTPQPQQPGLRAEARLDGQRGSLIASLGLRQLDLDGPLMLPGTLTGEAPLNLSLLPAGAQFEQQDIGLEGQLHFGDSVWVSIGGTLARARIVPAAALPGGLVPQWDTGTLTLGGGVGNFGGEIVGRVVEVPGMDGHYRNLGLGLTWRAPWKARLSVGAENLYSSGNNPFVSDEDEDTSRVPYIRYEQDL